MFLKKFDLLSEQKLFSSKVAGENELKGYVKTKYY